MLTLLALTLGPLSPSQALAFAPTDDLWVGVEPTRLLRYHEGQQTRLRNAPAWQDFIADDGAGWQARFDEQTGTPHRAWGPGIDLGPVGRESEVEQALRAFIADHPGLFGVSNDALALRDLAYVKDTGTWYVHFDRVVDGVPLYRSGVDARIRFGKLVMLGVDTHPQLDALPAAAALTSSEAVDRAIALGPEPDAFHLFESATLVVLPARAGSGLDYRLAWQVRTTTTTPPGIWVSHVDAATGELLNVYNEVRFIDGTLFARHEVRTLNNDYTISPVPLARVTNDDGTRVNADATGNFTLEATGAFTTSLRGDYVRVVNQDGDDAQATFTSDTFTWTTDDATQAEIDSYIFLHQVRDWGLEFAPDVDMVNDNLTSNVNIDSSCNAYYDGNVNFFRAGSGCNNTGRIADVNYHEWGHGFHYYSLVAGEFDGSISEGIGDTVAFLLTGDSLISPYFMTDGSGIREVASDRVYPDDWVGEVHTDGLIFAGAVWDLWDVLEQEYDAETAYDIVNELFVQGIKGGPTVPDSYDEFILADDDDGNLGNGTPNQCLILDAFSRHGLGPAGSESLVYVGHEALGNQVANAGDIPLVADVTNLAPDCYGFEIADAEVHYSIDGGETWETASLSASGDGVEGAIPEQPAGTVVHYYIELSGTDGDTLTNPGGGPINPHSFYVGELIEIRCDDFEDELGGDYTHELLSGDDDLGANDWQLGTPLGEGGDPDFAWSGDNVWGNDLGAGNWNGEYQNSKHNRLTSAPFDVSDYPKDALLVQFRRWLTVEDGYYDHARVMVDGEEAWSNHASNRNIGDEHHTDRQWGLHTLPVQDADEDGVLTLAWEIESDGGLTMGGWNIDDVCVYAIVPPSDQVDPDDTGDNGGVFDTGGGGLKASGCGCTSTPGNIPAGGAWLALLVGAAALLRRRR
ncbi:MAG: hypothetical protein H6739_18835 [Alphaproteobacteria bacterium]|nr:hypothetical protein [Alphaproteobacteria bacterium]